jgi:hypothetical protein
MKKNRSVLILLFVSLIFMSCRTPKYYIYAPSPPVNPFFKEKGDSKLSAYLSGGSGNHIPGADLQAGYAITKNIAVTGAYFSRREKDKYYSGGNNNTWTDSLVNRYRRAMGEVGAGYFRKVNYRGNATINIYGGYSWGTFSFKETGTGNGMGAYTRTHEADIRKWYIQPSIHFTRGRVFRLGIVTRFSFVNYGNIKTDFSTTELSDRTLNQFADRTHLFIEPTVNMQFAFPQPWLKLDMGITVCPIYDNSYEYNELRHRALTASIGLTFDLGKIEGKKK